MKMFSRGKIYETLPFYALVNIHCTSEWVVLLKLPLKLCSGRVMVGPTCTPFQDNVCTTHHRCWSLAMHIHGLIGLLIKSAFTLSEPKCGKNFIPWLPECRAWLPPKQPQERSPIMVEHMVNGCLPLSKQVV